MNNFEIVLKLILEKTPLVQIAKLTDNSINVVQDYITKNNISIPVRKTKITNDIIDKIYALNINGLTNKLISEDLNISPITVRKYLKSKEYNSLRSKPISDKEIILTSELIELIYGSLLGDMSVDKHWKEARLSITHSSKQEKYFDHKCAILHNYLGKISKCLRFDKRVNKFYNKCSVRSKCHPLFTKIYNEFYINGIKTINANLLEKLTPRSIAYWFMDDGSNSGVIATNCFSYEECVLIQKWFSSKYGIETTIEHLKNKSGVLYLIYILKNSRNTFYNLIHPYIIPSMDYKLKGWKLEP